MRGRIERDVRWCELLPAPRSRLPLFQPSHRFFEPSQVHVESYGLHVPRLLAAEQIPRSTQLEIAQRDAISRPQISMMLEHLRTLLRLTVDQIRHEPIAVRVPIDSPHPTQ